MSAPHLTTADLAHFTGTEHWYRHGLVRHILYTDGVQYVAERAGAYWLIDDIATAQHIAEIAAEGFQVWTLQVEPDHAATLTCEDGNGRAVYAKRIPWTDFPLDTITLWLTDRTILLPSEY